MLCSRDPWAHIVLIDEKAAGKIKDREDHRPHLAKGPYTVLVLIKQGSEHSFLAMAGSGKCASSAPPATVHHPLLQQLCIICSSSLCRLFSQALGDSLEPHPDLIFRIITIALSLGELPSFPRDCGAASIC